MKRIAGIMLLMTGISAFAQDNWTNYYNSAEVKVNYKHIECHDDANDIHKKLVVFQFVNLTGNAITVNFSKQLWYDGKCISCDDTSESWFSVRLAANETQEGNCSQRNKAFYALDKLLNVKSKSLTKFELTGIEISE